LVTHTRQTLHLAAICLLTLMVFWPATRAAVRLSLSDQRYAHTIFAPFVCALSIYWNRKELLKDTRYSLLAGVPLLSLSVLLGLIVMREWSPRDEAARLFPITLTIIFAWISAYVLCYGVGALKRAIYPLACLLLALPPPSALMDRIITSCQNASANLTYAILESFRVPVVRVGMNFFIPGLRFEVAPECSGIHSALAFLVASILAAYLFLRPAWARSILILSAIPLAIFKNAVRIAVIALLGAYVDRRFIDGPFHHVYGGVIFAPLEFVLFVLLIVILRKMDRPFWRAGSVPQTEPEPADAK
jgi:exosortase